MTAPTASSTSPLLWPSIGLVIGGALWGIIWLPLRALGGMGLNGAWPALVMFLGTLVVLLPFILFRIRRLSAIWLPLTLSGAFTGMAFSFYATSISLTEVVRAVLLFYLTPVWGTALGMIFLGERLSAARVAAIVLGLGGLFVILGDAGLPIPRNAGDWLALISGLSWAFGSLAVYRLKEPGIGEQIVAFLLGTTVVTLASVAFGGAIFGGIPDGEALRMAAPWGLLSALYVLPVLFLTIWPATLLTPGRVGLLLLSDVVVGVISAPLLTDEPFGMREAIGTVLIVSAGAVAVLERGD